VLEQAIGTQRKRLEFVRLAQKQVCSHAWTNFGQHLLRVRQKQQLAMALEFPIVDGQVFFFPSMKVLE
jgi:hypothetical protein